MPKRLTPTKTLAAIEAMAGRLIFVSNLSGMATNCANPPNFAPLQECADPKAFGMKSCKSRAQKCSERNEKLCNWPDFSASKEGTASTTKAGDMQAKQELNEHFS
jgi:hypothetical protein